MERCDPGQIIAATIRRLSPGADNADLIGEVVVQEMQRHGWLEDWKPVRVLGTQATPPEMWARS